MVLLATCQRVRACVPALGKSLLNNQSNQTVLTVTPYIPFVFIFPGFLSFSVKSRPICKLFRHISINLSNLWNYNIYKHKKNVIKNDSQLNSFMSSSQNYNWSFDEMDHRQSE